MKNDFGQFREMAGDLGTALEVGPDGITEGIFA